MPSVYNNPTDRRCQSTAAAGRSRVLTASEAATGSLHSGAIIKRAVDIAIAAIGLILLSPIMIISALALRLDSRGPIFCSRVQQNWGNHTFRALKFRCTTNAPASTRCDGLRMTRIGRVLRSSGIDGLPQLFNVLCGEMSIVGPGLYTALPEPIFKEHISRISRHRDFKPGLIGWALVNGRGNESNSGELMKRRIEYDLYYVENWSILLDVKVILMALCAKKTYAPIERMDGR